MGLDKYSQREYLKSMADLQRGEPIPQSVELDRKQFLTPEQIYEVWEMRGLKYRVAEFHKYCTDRGLLTHFRVDTFGKKVFRMLEQFLVEGETRRDPRYQPKLKPRKST